MIRLCAALAVLLLPGFLLSFLLALGERDWFHCFAYGDSVAPPLPSLFASGELTQVLLETLTPPFSHPLMTLLHFGPSLLFALFFYLAKSRAQRRTLLITLAVFVLFYLWTLLPPSGQHDCDRKGADSSLSLPLFAILGTLMALLANKLTCLAGACRHDDPTTPQ